MLCPYFIDTPLIPPAGRSLLLGGAMGKPDDVVDAGTRVMADSTIHGRALVIGPSVKIDDEWKLLPEDAPDVDNVAVWEVLGSDFIEVGKYSSILRRVHGVGLERLLHHLLLKRPKLQASYLHS